MSEYKYIFQDIKILDLTRVYSGPLATRLFADYGAEVLKIESIDNPDPTRNFPPLRHKWSGYYETLNRNKDFLSLNLKDNKDLEFFYDLCKEADVVVENLSPPTKTKLKVDYDTVRKFNPQIIYASLSGHDQDSDSGYYDLIAQAESGLLSLTGFNQPTKIGPAVVDATSGYNLAFGIASALFHRQRTGKGQWIKVSMLATAINMLEQNLIEYSLSNKNPQLPGNQDLAIAPFGIYKTQDSYISLAAGNPKMWQRFYQFLDSICQTSQDFTTNQQRLKKQTALTAYIEKCFAKFDTSSLIKKLNKIRVPCAKVAQMSDLANNSWLFRNKAVVKINHPLLGPCLVPGFAIDFSESQKKNISPIKM